MSAAPSPIAPARAGLGYRSDLDGLRGAMLAVMILFHTGSRVLPGGMASIDVFFVLSGFLISSTMLADLAQDRFTLSGFYERRARRILPALFVTLALCLPLAWLWLTPENLRDFGLSMASVAGFQSNHLFGLTQNYFSLASELKPLLHTWSLAVEEQFYLLYPLLLLVLYRHAPRLLAPALVVLGVASVALGEAMGFANPTLSYFLLPSRFFQFAAGGLCALALHRHGGLALHRWQAEGLGLAGMALVAGSFLLLRQGMPYPGIVALPTTLGAALLIMANRPGLVAWHVLSFRPLVWLGLISYSVYLFHQPLFAFARHRALGEPAPWVFAVLTLVAVVVGAISYRLVEKPFRNRQWVSRRRIFMLSGGGMALFGALGLALFASDGFPGRMPERARNLVDYSYNWQDSILARCPQLVGNPGAQGCTLNPEFGPPRIALVGDSHALAVTEALAARLATRRQSLLSLAHDGCPLAFVRPEDLRMPGQLDCLAFQRSLVGRLDAIAAAGVDTWIVLIAADPGKDMTGPDGKQRDIGQYLRTLLPLHQASIEVLLERGNRVVLVDPVPAYVENVPDTMLKDAWYHDGGLPDLSLPLSDYQRRNAPFLATYAALAEQPRVARAAVWRAFCPPADPRLCLTQMEGDPLYFDTNHPSHRGAELVVDEVLRALDSLPAKPAPAG